MSSKLITTLHYNVTVVLAKEGHIDQWIEKSPEIDPYKYSKPDFSQSTNAIRWRKDSLYE